MRTAAALAGTALTGAAAAVAAGRYGAAAALDPGGPAGFTDRPVTVRRVRGDTVTLTRTPAAALPGVYGLLGAGTHARVGPELPADGAEGTVVRILEAVTSGRLRPGTRLRVTPQVYAGSPRTALGFDHRDVLVPGELGGLPAWFVPGTRDTWVIAAHGLGAGREQALCVLPFLQDLGLPLLLLAHRGDDGAPMPSGGPRRLGHAEWRDLDAALRYATGHGARHVVLYGWSTGAVMALRTAAMSALRARVGGLILDSPVLDWQATVRALATVRRLPAALGRLAVIAAGERTGLGNGPAPADLWPGPGTPPVLIFHGPDDTVAPWQTSLDLAARHPDRVHLHTVPGGRHAAMWNAAPAAYEETLRRFLTPLL
nr:hypothetical protein [Streptomyces smaragdinus]